MSVQFERKAQYFTQKGWIANHFIVKSNLNSILKNRLKKTIENLRPHLSHAETPIHFNSSQYAPNQKPFTAPNTFQQYHTRQTTPTTLQDHQEFTIATEPQWQSKSSSFKTTLTHRKPLLFMKPYSRNRVTSLSIDQTKSEVYKQINNPDLMLFDSAFEGKAPIEYLTQYTDPTTYQSKSPVVAKRVHHHNRASLNILREKLKRRGGAEAQIVRKSVKKD